jgi:RsiW-degrading membrane proteinase PrsW (M82 family)
LEAFLSPASALFLLGVFSVPMPLIEEACKTLASGLVGRWVRPHAGRAYLWGVAGGVGFALVENLFSGALGGTEDWAVGAMARLGTTAMHCLTGGLVGWGWGQLWTARRPLRLLWAYAGSVAIHGMWNSAAAGAAFLGIGALEHKGDVLWQALVGLGTSALLALLGTLSLMSVVVLPLVGRRLADEGIR